MPKTLTLVAHLVSSVISETLWWHRLELQKLATQQVYGKAMVKVQRLTFLLPVGVVDSERFVDVRRDYELAPKTGVCPELEEECQPEFLTTESPRSQRRQEGRNFGKSWFFNHG